METDQVNDKLACWPTEMQLEKELWLVDQLTVLAEAFGESGEKMSPQRLEIYAGDLADLNRDQLKGAFTRARRECKFFPKIAELRELAGAGREQEHDAEGRKAWDVLMQFVSKYVGNDVHGNYGPEHGWYPKSYPKLSDRILDTVRRTGGWRLYKSMTKQDYPFQQKRFVEEYEAWTAVEQIAPSKLLMEMPRLQLVAKPMDPPRAIEPTQEQPETPAPKSKSIPEPLTDGQRRDRLEMLRQQVASLNWASGKC